MDGDLLVGGLVVLVTLVAAGLLVAVRPSVFDVTRLRLPGIFAAAYVVFILGAVPFVYRRFDTAARFPFLVSTCVGFLCTLAAVLALDLALVPRPVRVDGGIAPPIRTVQTWVVGGVAVVGVMLTVLYLVTLPEIPLLTLLSGSGSRGDLDVARENALKLLPGSIKYVFSLTRGTLLPLITVVAFLQYRERRTRGALVVLVVAASAALAFASASLEKSVVGGVLVVCIFGWVIARGRRVSGGALLLTGLAGLAFPLFVVVGTAGFKASAVVPSLLAIGRRLFYLPSEVLYRYFEYFPSVQPHLSGRSLPYLSKGMVGGNFPVENAVYRYAYAREITSGSANAAYVGALWADFGWPGVTVGAAFVGVLIRGLQELVDRLGRSTAVIALQAMLVYKMINLTATSAGGMLDPLGVGFDLPLTVAIVMVGLHLRRRVVRRRVGPLA